MGFYEFCTCSIRSVTLILLFIVYSRLHNEARATVYLEIRVSFELFEEAKQDLRSIEENVCSDKP